MSIVSTIGAGKLERDDVRFVGSINGCYTLASRRGQQKKDGGVEVFACRVLSVSPTSVAVTAPVIGAENEELTTNLDHLGIVSGRIERLIPDGFVFNVEASKEERANLAAKIRWLKHKRVHQERDRREHPRVPPREPRSMLKLPDGKVMRCMLIDISRSGAAVSADIKPVLGMSLTVGTVPARVVRELKVGFAVQFDELLVSESLEKRLCMPSRAAQGQGSTG